MPSRGGRGSKEGETRAEVGCSGLYTRKESPTPSKFGVSESKSFLMEAKARTVDRLEAP